MRLRAVILDWAGTIADFGSLAPVTAIRQVFENAGVPVSVAEVRAFMGKSKRAHIENVLELPRVCERWIASRGAPPALTDLDALYSEFVPAQLAAISQHAALIPGVAPAIARMRDRGLKIGTTTGYNRTMLDVLLECAAEQGLAPDSAVCPDDVGSGRPAPFMCYLNALRLGVYPLSAFVKIGDTPSDIEEGLNAAMWTIGVTETGNEVGLSECEWNALSEPERNQAAQTARQRLADAGAHYTAASAAECDAILDEIEERLGRGDKP